jgi:hypothetical protein
VLSELASCHGKAGEEAIGRLRDLHARHVGSARVEDDLTMLWAGLT